MKRIFKLTAVLISLFSLNLSHPLAQNEPLPGPEARMAQIAERTFARIQRELPQIKHNMDHLRVIAKEEVLPYVHIQYVGALILGRHFQQTSPELRKRFFEALEQYLEKLYGQALSTYNGQTYQLSSPRALGDQLVSTRVTLTNIDSTLR